ncbi:LuxR C-terminal-related transcriptional regulator [Mycetocola zhadangensis]|uniref:HTH luxR-type domain-containing protein n=1 Tax=Mycetocola zhadangensis TaxID=1164595 RepID=A0A3L7JD03_9MICO|nr:LuxR C-terminal-related transcriptional regulator [Mycetocola zhadangensis]RLQ86372.1 hypothetical protein D9V28_06020 [Mycetocola zhadangensis]GGE90652.1 hypothetical protein GCM10011313_11900 [Mycetocola zhadangensis]
MSASSHPTTKEHLIERPALLGVLDGALNRRLTLITAQAGAGKTTLLKQWATTHADRAFTQLDIEPDDDDPARFVGRLVAALTKSRPTVARVPRTAGPHSSGLDSHLSATLTSALAKSPETVLLLDDVHRFTNVSLVADLGRLIEQMPESAHVVMASRVDPPIALGNHRLNDDLLELRPAHLAFSERESAAFLERIVGRPVDPQQVRVLREKTEGWAAGLQLAGLHLRHEADPDAFVAQFNGSDRLVADYLGEEVIDGLPPERRHLLLKMSALDDMCAGLVEAAIGPVYAQQVLEELEHECMFLIPLDARRQWFRFHHLFSELLRSRLRVENPAAELQILTAAADWHLSRGRVKPALDYLFRAQARDGAMEAMLTSSANDATERTETTANLEAETAELWTSDVVDEDLFAGVRHARQSESASAQEISPLPGPFSTATPRRGWGFVAAQVLWRTRPDISTEEAQSKVATLSNLSTAAGAPSPDLADALVSGGRAYFLAGNTDEARRWLSMALLAASGDVVGRVSALSALSLVEAWCRNTVIADRLVRDALETARDAGMLAQPAIADAHLAAVLTSLEPGKAVVSTTLPELRHSHSPPDSFPAETGSPGEEKVRHPLVPRTATRPDNADLGAFESPKLVPTVLFDRAAASISLGDTELAREVVEAWDELVQVHTPLSVVQHHILRARLAGVDEMPDESIRHLTAALQIAEVHGFVDVFVQAGPLILQRLSMLSGPQSAFSDIVRTRARRELEPSPVGLSEPLTERELEVLAFLPTRYTNLELARRFFVSVNTIKTHMAHIYRKLDATTRDNAIERARELGLL